MYLLYKITVEENFQESLSIKKGGTMLKRCISLCLLLSSFNVFSSEYDQSLKSQLQQFLQVNPHFGSEKYKMSPLERAVRMGNLESVRRLLLDGNTDPNIISPSLKKALIRIAYEEGNYQIVQEFLHHESLDLSTIVDDQQKYYAIHLLVALGDIKRLEKRKKLPLHLKTTQDHSPVDLAQILSYLRRDSMFFSEFKEKRISTLYTFLATMSSLKWFEKHSDRSELAYYLEDRAESESSP